MITLTGIIVWIVFLFFLYFMVFWLLVFLEKPFDDVEETTEYFPLVTVAIPAYNEEDSIAGTLDSVLKLDYPLDKLEIIVINDGSKDRTEEIVNKIIADNPSFNIRMINQANHGKGVAMNNALGLAKGVYFVPLDADSFIDSDALKKIQKQFKEVVKEEYRPLTIHRYHPRSTLGGIFGLLSFESEYVGDLIEQGFQDAVTHNCEESGCIFPTYDDVATAKQMSREMKASAAVRN